ncbi:MAG: ATP-binding protein [Acholeplasmataceae bacterium]|jgi:AAA+ ATPase superfamily predicted ATPase|nr:ATP-binding protein [Acholeplasmataceae bacterium]
MFIDREKELMFLEEKLNSKIFEFGVLHGRRRVGKTVFIKEAIKGKNAIYFQAHQTNMEINLELLSSLYGKYKNMVKISYNSMYELFRQFF